MSRPLLTPTLVLAATGLMAPRPSVDQIDTAPERNRHVMCAAADARGDTYRPFSCTSRFTCDAPPSLTSCTQAAPGRFEATSDPFDVCVPERHQCAAVESCGPFGCATSDICSSSSRFPCGGGAGGCPSGEVCEPLDFPASVPRLH